MAAELTTKAWTLPARNHNKLVCVSPVIGRKLLNIRTQPRTLERRHEHWNIEQRTWNSKKNNITSRGTKNEENCFNLGAAKKPEI